KCTRKTNESRSKTPSNSQHDTNSLVLTCRYDGMCSEADCIGLYMGTWYPWPDQVCDLGYTCYCDPDDQYC
ncbi:hypothetical protein PMAYCL1PPCAC_22813, partial [Pristionchus mayeri]